MSATKKHPNIHFNTIYLSSKGIGADWLPNSFIVVQKDMLVKKINKDVFIRVAKNYLTSMRTVDIKLDYGNFLGSYVITQATGDGK